MSMPDAPIHFTSDLSDFDHRLACKCVLKHFMPYFRPAAVGCILLMFFGYALTIFLNRLYETGDFNGLILLFFLGLAALILLLIHRQKRVWRAIKEAPLRQGLATISLDDKGMKIENPGMTQTIFWSHAVDVIDGNDGLLVLSGAVEPHPIPTQAIPEGIALHELRDQIRRWISQAQS